jgi:molybdopterin-guanine dinucleotide biosynthesis protein A
VSGKVTAVLLAGRRPGVDPLAAYFGVEDKALVELAGEPMLSRVARTLLHFDEVAEVIVLAQDPGALTQHPRTRWIEDEPGIRFEDSGSSIAEGVAAVLRRNPNNYPFLITTADNVLLDRRMLRSFSEGAAGSDVAAALVERRTLLAAYPNSRRTWLPFRKGAYSGANLFWLGSPKTLPLLGIWRAIEQDRKKKWRVAGAFGPLMLIAALLRILTVKQAFSAIGRRYGIIARPVILPFAEACIDVDKPADHALASQILARRAGEEGQPLP